jgi:hypothetical protein
MQLADEVSFEIFLGGINREIKFPKNDSEFF